MHKRDETDVWTNTHIKKIGINDMNKEIKTNKKRKGKGSCVGKWILKFNLKEQTEDSHITCKLGNFS